MIICLKLYKKKNKKKRNNNNKIRFNKEFKIINRSIKYYK